MLQSRPAYLLDKVRAFYAMIFAASCDVSLGFLEVESIMLEQMFNNGTIVAWYRCLILWSQLDEDLSEEKANSAVFLVADFTVNSSNSIQNPSSNSKPKTHIKLNTKPKLIKLKVT